MSGPTLARSKGKLETKLETKICDRSLSEIDHESHKLCGLVKLERP